LENDPSPCRNRQCEEDVLKERAENRLKIVSLESKVSQLSLQKKRLTSELFKLKEYFEDNFVQKSKVSNAQVSNKGPDFDLLKSQNTKLTEELRTFKLHNTQLLEESAKTQLKLSKFLNRESEEATKPKETLKTAIATQTSVLKSEGVNEEMTLNIATKELEI
jgi:hypothetical protein